MSGAGLVREVIGAEAATPEAEPVGVAVWLTYDPADPLAVRLTVQHGFVVRAWQLAVELLADGLDASSGAGSVRIRPLVLGGGVMARLRSPGDAPLAVSLPRGPVERFLARAELAAPSETALSEQIDRELAGLLGPAEQEGGQQ